MVERLGARARRGDEDLELAARLRLADVFSERRRPQRPLDLLFLRGSGPRGNETIGLDTHARHSARAWRHHPLGKAPEHAGAHDVHIAPLSQVPAGETHVALPLTPQRQARREFELRAEAPGAAIARFLGAESRAAALGVAAIGARLAVQ